MNKHMSQKYCGLAKLYKKKSTVIAMYLLDFVLPQVAKLSKFLSIEKLDLTAISDLVDSTLLTLDDALLPIANWVLELLDAVMSFKLPQKSKLTLNQSPSFKKMWLNCCHLLKKGTFQGGFLPRIL